MKVAPVAGDVDAPAEPDLVVAEGVALGEGPATNDLTLGLACMALGCVAVYASLFATGLALYGRTLPALALAATAAAATVAIVTLWRRLETKTA